MKRVELFWNYVPCAHKRAWLCFDLDNGDSNNKNDPGKGYVWVFKTREEARKHKQKQKDMKFGARLSQPIKVSC
jgi:hypothetical protein